MPVFLGVDIGAHNSVIAWAWKGKGSYPETEVIPIFQKIDEESMDYLRTLSSTVYYKDENTVAKSVNGNEKYFKKGHF